MKTKLLFLSFLFNYCFLNAQTALNFNGQSGGYVTLPYNTSLQINQGTIEAWIKTPDAGNSLRIIIQRAYNYGIFLKANEVVVYEWATSKTYSTGVFLNDDKWHHVAFSFNKSVTNGSKIYVDGVLKLSFRYGFDNSSLPLTVGGSTSVSQNFNGKIDQVRIWNTIRSDAEILASYNKCLQGNETGLVLLWQFEEGTGTAVNDLSGNGNNGTFTGTNVTWVTGYNCIPNNLVAYYPFNGNANDESGNGNNGTVNGATLTTDKEGLADSAYEFDGINNFIQVANSSSLNVFNSDLTISMWLYNDNPSLTDNTYKGISKGGWDTGAGYELVYSNFWNDGTLHFTTGSGGNNVYAFNTYNNQWIMLTGTYENATATKKMYINGILQASIVQASSSLTSSLDDLFIGRRHPANNYSGFVKGKMDEIRIYNSALSASEILQLYNTSALGVSKNPTKENNSVYVSNKCIYFNENQNLSQIKSISVYNLLAQKVYQLNTFQKENRLPLKQGIYILKVAYKNNQLSTKKFIIK